MKAAVFSVGFFVLSVSAASADQCNAPLPAPGTPFAGEVSYIVDGDGFCVGRDQGGIEVRLADFNAIELDQQGGREAKEALKRISFGKRVECVAGKKSWDRTIARCTLDGQPLGDLMRAAGISEGGN